MTTAQLQTLKAAILADPFTAAQPAGSDGDFAIAAYLNELVSPAFTVWRTSVSINEIMANGFDWTRVDNASTGEARIWEWMTALGEINPSRANIRAGIEEAWKGTAQAQINQRAAIYIHCKRDATRFEKVFATGTGTVAVPATMTLEGPLSLFDVDLARTTV
jgi:hypothetical protein